MEKSEEAEISIKSNDNQNNNTFSLLLPYYTTDKWTNKLKRKVKTLAKAYKDFYKKIEEENNPFYKTNYPKYKTQSYFHYKNGNNYNKMFSNPEQNVFHRTSTNFANFKTNTHLKLILI